MNGADVSKSLTVLLDLDSIIVDIWEPWYREHNRRWGDDLSIEKVTSWDIGLFVKPGSRPFDIINEKGFYIGLRPLPGAINGVNRLVRAGHKVYILSAAPSLPSWSEKAAWVAGWLPRIDQKNIIFTHAKTLVKGDVLFDDGPHNLLGYRAAWPKAKLATIAYPYNQVALLEADLVAGDHHGIARAWSRFTAWVEDLSNE